MINRVIHSLVKEPFVIILEANNTCFYGNCYYCKSEADGVCAKGSKLEGAVVLWLPSSYTFRLWRHPWGRTYKKGKHAR